MIELKLHEPPVTHEPGDCPGGCEEIKITERRLNEGAKRMTSIEGTMAELGKKLDDHMSTSSETNATVLEVLDILHAGKGFFKTLGYIATAIQWTAGFVAPVLGLWYMLKDSGHK